MSARVRLTAVVAASALLSGCALPYYWQAVGGQLALLGAREPIDRVIADGSVDPATRARLESVVDLRDFAATELGLPDNGSYRTYVALERDYVVWNVIAAEAFSVEPLQWCFPVAGCVSYRGYFDREKALAFEHKLAADGYDTYSGGSTAYSTLGYFDDPVLSTMLAGSPVSFAAVLFHELAHQRIYVRGDSEFSEAFASVVEEYGVERWLVHTGDTQALAAYRERRARAADFSALVAAQRARLAAIYAQPLPHETLRARKTEAFRQMRAEYQVLKSDWGGASDYDGWFDGEMNNATLAAISTYRKWLPGLRWRLREIGITAFFDEVESLADAPEAEREAVLESWNAASSDPAGRAQAG